MRSNRKKYDGDMRPEYDFSKGVRGKYFERYRDGASVRILKPRTKRPRRTK
jgi:hypothetical protein